MDACVYQVEASFPFFFFRLARRAFYFFNYQSNHLVYWPVAVGDKSLGPLLFISSAVVRRQRRRRLTVKGNLLFLLLHVTRAFIKRFCCCCHHNSSLADNKKRKCTSVFFFFFFFFCICDDPVCVCHPSGLTAVSCLPAPDYFWRKPCPLVYCLLLWNVRVYTFNPVIFRVLAAATTQYSPSTARCCTSLDTDCCCDVYTN